MTLKGNGTLVNASGGRRLDGESGGGSGRTYIFDAGDLPSGDGVSGGDAVFYVGSLRGDFGGPAGRADGTITDADVDGFLAAFGLGDLAADFRGTASGATDPDGRLTPADLDAFIAYYDSPENHGRRLNALPNPGPEGGPQSAGDPVPVTLGAAPTTGAPLSSGAEVDLLTATVPVGAGAPSATADGGSAVTSAAVVAPAAEIAPAQANTAEADSGLGLLVISEAPTPVVYASDAAASTEATDSPDDEAIDLLAIPALEVPLAV